MAEIEKKPIKITETVLRDAHQSLIATRLTTEQMLPIVDKMDKVGYHSVECWGGATFDASLRFLKEDPWERLRKFRDGFKNTKLQMLFRGQNILGYRPYADDVVEYFVQKSVANGIDIIRIFDCLNDLRNLQTAVTAANKEGAHAQVALSYTLGDAYTTEYWVEKAKKVEEMGANSICLKDMAGLLLPYRATELIGALKDAVDIPIQLHTHYTSGVASMTYLKAVEAGVDVIDTAMSPFALGTSQPATEVMVETFKGTPYDTGFDQTLLAEIADYFRPIRDDALDSGLLNPKNMGVNIKTLLYQVPGGMLSNLTSQLAEQGAEDKFYDVLEEVPKVRKDLGEPPLVTPSSQIVGTQAVFNVLMGERYKMATKETKDILSGKYGETVKPFNEEVKKKVLPADAEIITCRPADLIPDELDTLRDECAQWIEQDEDVLYRMFGKNAELLIDHAWGWEPCTIADIKAYRPGTNSISSGQVLSHPYEYDKARLVVKEMTDLLVLDLVDKDMVTDQMVLTVGYDIDNLTDPARKAGYRGEIEIDRYGRKVPKTAHGSINLGEYTSSTRIILRAVSELFDRIVNPDLLVRRMYVVANHAVHQDDVPKTCDEPVQLDLFTDYEAEAQKRREKNIQLEKERRLQKAALAIKRKYGKNAILKGMNLEEGATARDRNRQIGGHKA